MSNTTQTLHTNELPKQVEQEFELVRASYLFELQQLRSKYKKTLAGLTIKYAAVCGMQLDGRR